MNRRTAALGLASLSLIPINSSAAETDWAGLVIDAFERLGSDLSAIEIKSKTYANVNAWRVVSDLDVSAAGGTACVIPVAGYAALPVEFLYLMREIYNSAMGIGFIVNGSAVRDDFANILAVWTGQLKLDDPKFAVVYDLAEEVVSEVGENAAEHVIEEAVLKVSKRSKAVDGRNRVNGSYNASSAVSVAGAAATSKTTGKIASKVLAQKAGTKAAGKISTKIAAKAGTKISAKYAAKAFTAWVPIISGVACAGINAWIMDSILASAESYFYTLRKYRSRRTGIRR